MSILKETRSIQNSCRTSLASAALVSVVAVFGPAGPVLADLDDHTLPCMQTASGKPHLNCTANDMAIAGMTVMNQIGDCRTNPDGVWSFDGTITVGADPTTRYDLGLYIGFDGVQALVGDTCWVDVIEEGEPGDTWFDNDGDLCGDHPSGVDVTIGLHDVTVTCADVNQDGDADIPVCVSYENNSDIPCNTETDAIPENDAKCQCFIVNTGVHIGCESNADCVADANPCTAAVCLGPGEPGTNILGCIQAPVTGSCDDGLFCNGSDECTDGTCVHSGDPCDGGGVCESCNEPADNCFVAAGTPCRAAQGVCDVAENCTGEAVDCPADALVASDTVCRASAGVCDPAEHCTGQAAACPADVLDASDVVCRAVSGVCDTAEHCTGAAAGCPADAFLAPDAVCRASAGVCDLAETCTGQGPGCPVDAFAAPEIVCRASAGICDVTENCTGAAADCPADGFVSSATACRASAGVCDPAENCTGAAAECPADVLTSTDMVCRAANGVCDVAEHCTAAAAGCPDDAFVPSETVCRASAGVCDAAENCTGQAPDCPADAFVSSATTCRASAGVCDVAEHCTGSAAPCPADAFVSSATSCRASAGVCDVAEHCSGSSPDCPADAFVSSATTCRASAGVCDVAEQCTGSAAACPANGFQPSQAACTTDGNVCTNDVCDGAGNCQHPNNTAPCDDGLFCTVTDACAGGSCTGSPRNCSDGTGCTVDSCDEGSNTCLSRPDDDRCDDEDACTIDTCHADTGCAHVYACKDICRDSGFWGKRGGDGNVTQELLDALGGIEVCGQSITATSVNDSVAGLGLSSALEGLCVRVEGIPVRSLYRELVTTALNCGISGSSDCDQVVAPFIDVAYSTCDSLCAGELDLAAGESLEATCVRQLSCYNRGGRLVDGRCAYGTCDVTDELCGGDHGACPPVAGVTFPILQVCERFPDNCRDGTFCQEALGICPDRLPASSTRACREAKTNACTIDECSFGPD